METFAMKVKKTPTCKGVCYLKYNKSKTAANVQLCMHTTKVKSIRCMSTSLCYLTTIINVEHVLLKECMETINSCMTLSRKCCGNFTVF